MEEAKPVEIWEMIRMVAAAPNYNARNSSSSVRRKNEYEP
jgi:hypothetical protein